MSLVTELRKTLYAARSIAGRLGFRVHTVSIVKRFAYGEHTGDLDEMALIPLTEQDGYSPKTSWLNGEELAVGGLPAGTVEIGPITPAFPGGGTDLSVLTGGDLTTGDMLQLLITGPNHPDGALYRIKDIKADKALNYKITAIPTSAYTET